MSFEGTIQKLCTQGHLSHFDIWHEGKSCKCGASFNWTHVIDETNGSEPEDYNLPVEIDFEDEWHTDHYGNRYAVKIPLYKPPKPLKDTSNDWSSEQWEDYLIPGNGHGE